MPSIAEAYSSVLYVVQGQVDLRESIFGQEFKSAPRVSPRETVALLRNTRLVN
ncbi:MAG: hypothetical protein ACRD88_13255 [Terriglobia bacterium]